jgi:predicted transcriptional regulator
VTELLVSDQKKIEILKALMDGKIHTYYHLAKSVKTNYLTVKRNCWFLKLLGFIEIITVKKEESATGRPYHGVRITEKAIEFIEDMPVNFK